MTMNSSSQLTLIFLGLSGSLIALLAFFFVWFLAEEGYRLTVMSSSVLVLLMLFLAVFSLGHKYFVKLIGAREEEKERVEAQLIGYSARLTSFIENPKYVSIYSLDRNYCYTGFNSLHKRDMEDIFDVNVFEGLNILEVLPEDVSRLARFYFDRTYSGEHFTVTNKFQGRYYTQIFNPVFGQMGEVIGLTGNVLDVTERIRADQELESYKDRLETLVKDRTVQLERQTLFFQKIIDNLPNLIFVRDINHRYLLVNQAMADYFGCSKADLVGESVAGTHHDLERAKQFEKEDGELIMKGGVVEEEGLHTWPDGSKKWLFLSKRRMELEEDRYILGVHFDITYLKDTEHKLQKTNNELNQTLNKLKSAQLRLIEAEKMASLGQLTAGLAHEINNPLNYVAGNVGPIREDLRELKSYLLSLEKFRRSAGHAEHIETDPVDGANFEELFEELESLLSGVDEGTARVKSLMKDLSMFALPEGSRHIVCDINECIQSTINLVQYHLKSRIQLIREFGDIPKTLCNPQQLNQVFLNILNNAIQAIDETGKITVTTEALESHILVRIRDTGRGIPKENISRIFDPFFTTKEVGEGTGLGLAISYRIVKEHGGTIRVRSSVDDGSSFEVKLPVVLVS